MGKELKKKGVGLIRRIGPIGWYALFVIALVVGLFAYGISSGKDPDAATRNVNDYGGLMSAVTAVGADNAFLLISDMQTIPSGTSLTIGPNTQIMVTPGAGVSVASGASLYMYAAISAGPYRIFYGAGASVFGTNAFQPYWNEEWVGGTTLIGVGKRPGSYGLDVGGPLRADSLSGSYNASELTGTLSNSQLPNPITRSVESGSTITGKNNVVKLKSNETISGATLIGATAITGASTPGRSPTAGVSAFMSSPSGGESCFYFNSDNTAATGNSMYVTFQPGDTVKTESGYPITAGVTKIEISGTTLAQVVTVISTGPAEWVVTSKAALNLVKQ